MSAFTVGWLVMTLLMGAVGYGIGDKKGRPGLGLALGLVIGVFGVIIIALVPTKSRFERELPYAMGLQSAGGAPPAGMVACPSCRTPMHAAETVCRRCGTHVVQGRVDVPQTPSSFSAIEPEAWWYQEQGQPPPSHVPNPSSSGAPMTQTPPPPPPAPPPAGTTDPRGSAF